MVGLHDLSQNEYGQKILDPVPVLVLEDILGDSQIDDVDSGWVDMAAIDMGRSHYCYVLADTDCLVSVDDC